MSLEEVLRENAEQVNRSLLAKQKVAVLSSLGGTTRHYKFYPQTFARISLDPRQSYFSRKDI
jgi:uncharacterized protein YjfI (DUF2170 family)